MSRWGRPIMGRDQWKNLCLLISEEPPSYVTACRGRWMVELETEVFDEPPLGRPLCGWCFKYSQQEKTP